MTDMTKTPGNIAWIEHRSQDVAGAVAFYKDVLQFKVAPMDMTLPDGSPYYALTVGERPVGGFTQGEGGWLTYLTVEDVDDSVQKAFDGGAEVVTAPHSVPGVGRMATIKDPAGGEIALFAYVTAEGTSDGQ
jgi:hypothetical protein